MVNLNDRMAYMDEAMRKADAQRAEWKSVTDRQDEWLAKASEFALAVFLAVIVALICC